MQEQRLEIKQVANGWLLELTTYMKGTDDYPAAFYETENLARKAAVGWFRDGRIPNGDTDYLENIKLVNE